VGTLELALAIIGGVALLFGLAMATWRASMMLTWKRREATVVSYSRQRASRGSQNAKVVVRITGDDGEAVEAADYMPWNRYHAEQVITVLQDPDAPDRVVVPELLRFWMMTLIFIPFGLAFLYCALVYVPSLGGPP
jgi:hypothetical protein